MGVTAARRIAPGRGDRDLPLSGDQPRDYLDLGIDQRRPLRLGEALDVVAGEADVILELLTDTSCCKS